MRRSHPAITVAVLGLALASWGGSCDDESEPLQWVLKFEDEFEGPAGQLPDPSMWTFDVGTGFNGWGNQQLEYDTARPENVSLDGNGHLQIVAREEQYQGSDYTSARIKTQGRFALDSGRFEARIKLPIGQGIWPAFWMLGDDFEQVGWPNCGEIDVMEYRGQQPSRVLGSVHGPGYSGGQAITRAYDLGQGTFNDGFHVFAVDWNEDGITWSVDGTPYHTVRPSDLPQGARWVYDHPFFMILNVAVGGTFVGAPDASTVFPQPMLVDWVRVYRLE